MNYREESDSLGSVKVPESAYFGAQTQRAIENFPISDLRFSNHFIYYLSLIKKCAALTNESLSLLDKEKSQAISQACQEVMEGKFDREFVVDVFQTGSGTSTNMNMNEVLATRANEILTGEKKTKHPVHPNDHVNLGQSTNDVFPSCIHLSALTLIKQKLIPSLQQLHNDLADKSRELDKVKKIGRTHLQDAVPLSLGDEFSGYARQAQLSVKRLQVGEERLLSLTIGGTAVGNGLNAHPEFAPRAISMIADYTGFDFYETPNHFESQAACDSAVEVSGTLKTIAVSLIKMANDIRWLASGPRCGLGEINLPVLQPGSSIMPGKVNPVIPEAVIQVGAQVIGNDSAITLGGEKGYFELNAMFPLIAYNLLQSIELLSNAAQLLATGCVRGITANEKRCSEYIAQSLAVVTSLVPHIGYDRAADLAKKAYETGRSIEDVAISEDIMGREDLKRILYGPTGG